MAQDLYQLHWASRAAVKTEKYPERPLPEEVPLEETLAALEECKAEGKIKHIGVCNFGVEDLKRALATGTMGATTVAAQAGLQRNRASRWQCEAQQRCDQRASE